MKSSFVFTMSILPTNHEFIDRKWSIFEATFNNPGGKDFTMPASEQLDSLGTISALYMYVNPPPLGYGTQAPKVAESVIRAREYNRNDEPERQVGPYRVNKAYWDSKKPFPFDEIHGNFHAPSVHSMVKKFLTANHQRFDRAVERVMDTAIKKNSDSLTTGRQTWCPINELSLPCPNAYFNMSDLFVNNGLPAAASQLGWIRNAMLLADMEEIKTSRVVHVLEKTKNNKKGMDKKTVKRKARIRKYRETGENKVFEHVVNYMRSFCSYIKHGERGKKDRRAIASANVILRMFLYLIEEVHLVFSEDLPGSVAAIGGEAKKSKVILNLTTNTGNFTDGYQATQDATKWNEALSADIFGMFHMTMLDDETREELQLPPVTPLGNLFKKIAITGHFLLAIKMITLGSGPTCFKGNLQTKPTWEEKNLDCFNTQTKEWFSKLIPYRVGNNYVESGAGMLMGMHNMLSTVIGLLPNNWMKESNSNFCTTTLRASDDSMTLFLGSNKMAEFLFA